MSPPIPTRMTRPARAMVETASHVARALPEHSSRHVGLYPGVSKELILTLHNSDRKYSVLVRRVRVRDIATTSAGCAPARRNLTIRLHRGAPVRIPPGRTRRVTALLSMPDTVSNACQRATFRLRYTAQARAGR